MVFHLAPVVLLGALLTKSDLLSHITKRVVDTFGGEPAENRGTFVTVINRLPDYPVSPPPEFDPTDWMVTPPPDRFVMLSGMVARPCVMGVMMDGVIGDPPAIRWDRVPLDTPVTVELSDCDLGTFFAEIVPATGTLNVRQVKEYDRSHGHRVFALRT